MHYNHVHADLTVAAKLFNVVKIQRYVQVKRTAAPFDNGRTYIVRRIKHQT